MIKKQSSNAMRQKRHLRIRNKISGTASCPRLSVYRSNSHIQVQIVDDDKGTTLVSVSSSNLKLENGGNVAAATAVGSEIAKLAKAKQISKVVFDRSGYLYHGRIKALAEAARAGGLEF